MSDTTTLDWAPPQNDNPIPPVCVWWVADCGFLHVETDPVTVPLHCPDGITREAKP